MRLPLAIRAAAFDLDGTLLDTLPDLAAAAQRTLVDLGRPQVESETVRRYIGDGVSRLVERLLAAHSHRAPAAPTLQRALALFERNYRATLAQQTRPFPGVEEGLSQFLAVGLQLACVTNKTESFTLPLLEATGLRGFFDLVVAGDTLARKKPDPLPLLYCAQQFGTQPAELLMIGDSAQDTLCARAAGCPVFCVPYGYGAQQVRELDCDAIVPTIVEAARLVTPVRS